jgi:hypothetical protein
MLQVIQSSSLSIFQEPGRFAGTVDFPRKANRKASHGD